VVCLAPMISLPTPDRLTLLKASSARVHYSEGWIGTVEHLWRGTDRWGHVQQGHSALWTMASGLK
jgi:hypothetical protein